MCSQRLQAQQGDVFDLWMFFFQQERAWKIVYFQPACGFMFRLQKYISSSYIFCKTT